MTLVSIQTVLMNVAMAYSTQNSKPSSKQSKKVVSLGQRHINITRNAKLVQNVSRRIAENFNLKGLHRLDINWTIYLLSFFFGVINVVDYFFMFV